MKICLMTQNARLYSSRRILEAAREQGHEIDILDTPNAYMNVVSHKPRVKYKGKEVPLYDAVIPRIGAPTTFYGLAVLRQFEMMGVWPLNESVAIGRSRDKLRSMQLLSRKGVGLPITAFANSTADIDDMIDMVGGAPVVIKLLEGTQGIGVILAETHMSAKSTIEAFRNVNVNILVQEYIKESEGTDIRCLVIGEKVVAAMQRKGAKGEFRSNIHRGGSGEIVKITPEERSVAVRSASIMGLNVCGVDLLRSNHGPVVMEVNSTPGLEGVEKSTGIDVAGKIIQFIEKQAKPNKTKTRGKG